MKLFTLIALFVLTCLVVPAQDKPSVIVLTDIGGDPDDEQSLVRFLLYSDMFDVKAMCATSRMGNGQDTRPDIIQRQIDAYRKVYPNLMLHSGNYPSPDDLASIVKNGQGDQFHFGKDYDTEASDFIIKVIDKAEKTVHVVIWGGQRELVQALWKVKNTRNKEQVIAFCKKMQVHAIGDQDKHRDWILDNFKDVRYIADAFVFPGYFGLAEISTFRGMYMTGDVSMQNGNWVKTNIIGNGPLSDCYPVNGAGTDGMKEGDSPSFLGLIENGLNIPEKPDWGGWGGRYRLLDHNLFIDASDFLNGTLNERHTVARWRPAFQHDFMARLKWCVEPYNRANHNPEAIVNGSSGFSPLSVSAKIGEKLVFDASGSHDPDGNALSFNWFFYNEISYPGCIGMKLSSGGEKCTVTIPGQLRGRSIHLILEITDSGTPSLTSYKRMVIHII